MRACVRAFRLVVHLNEAPYSTVSRVVVWTLALTHTSVLCHERATAVCTSVPPSLWSDVCYRWSGWTGWLHGLKHVSLEKTGLAAATRVLYNALLNRLGKWSLFPIKQENDTDIGIQSLLFRYQGISWAQGIRRKEIKGCVACTNVWTQFCGAICL